MEWDFNLKFRLCAHVLIIWYVRKLWVVCFLIDETAMRLDFRLYMIWKTFNSALYNTASTLWFTKISFPLHVTAPLQPTTVILFLAYARTTLTFARFWFYGTHSFILVYRLYVPAWERGYPPSFGPFTSIRFSLQKRRSEFRIWLNGEFDEEGLGLAREVSAM